MSASNYVASEARKICQILRVSPDASRRPLPEGEGTFCTTCASAMTYVCRGSALTKATDKNFQSTPFKFSFQTEKNIVDVLFMFWQSVARSLWFM